MQQKSKLFVAIIFFISQSIFAQNNEKKLAIIDGTKIEYKLFRPDSIRKANELIVVFESGVGGGSFEQILPFLPKNITGFEYDRKSDNIQAFPM